MKKTKRLIFAAFTLALSLAMTVTSTFAWFIRGANPEISSFELEALSYVPNLLISLNQSSDPEDWKTTDGYKTTWTTGEFFEALAGINVVKSSDDRVAAHLGAYTTDNGYTFYDETGASAGTNIFNNKELDATTGSVLQFKIRFRSDSNNLKVALHSDAGLTALKVDTAKSKPVFTWDNSGSGTGEFSTADFGMNKLDTNTDKVAPYSAPTVGAPVYLSSAYAARLSFATMADPSDVALNDLTTTEIRTSESLIKKALKVAIYGGDEGTYSYQDQNYLGAYFTNSVNSEEAFNGAWNTYWTGVIAAVAEVEKNADGAEAVLAALLPGAVSINIASATTAKIWNPQATNSINDDANLKGTNADYYIIDDIVDARMNTSANTGGVTAATKNFAAEYKKTILSSTVTGTTHEKNDFDEVDTNGMADLQKNTIVTLNQVENFGGVDYYFGEIILNIWLEGWDTSCTNSILSDVFGVSLKFTNSTGV